MTHKRKIIVLTIVLLAVVGVFTKPYLFPAKEEFTATANPLEAYQQALEGGTPIFMEPIKSKAHFSSCTSLRLISK